MGGVSVAVAQAMRYAGCPNRRSLGVREVFPLAGGGGAGKDRADEERRNPAAGRS